MIFQGVEFRVVRGFESYFVSADGRVLSTRRPWTRELKGVVDKGRRRFQVYREDGSFTLIPVAALILLAWVGERPPGCYACHRNDDRRDDVLPNLYWGSPADNAADSVRNGRYRRGNKHGMSKLTASIVQYLKTEKAKGRTYRDLADEVGVHWNTVRKALKGYSWKDPGL